MYLTRERIEPKEFLETNGDLASGASVIFLGVIRNHSENRSVLFLEYEAYEAMAEKLIGTLIERARAQWPVNEIRIRHRLGRVGLGETAVAIEVRADHRDEAYQASRFMIEEIKHRVPIWKKEHFADGTSEWSLCGRHQHA